MATSRSQTPGVPLDAETAAARDSFLALGAALESATSEFDEAEFVSRLSREQTCSRNRPTNDVWPYLIAGVLAASALFAIVRIAFMSQEARPQIAVITKPDREAKVQRPSPTLTWNDPLDDEIALAAATIEQFGSHTRGFDGSIIQMNVQLEALSQELLRESL
jgi:hypothetical protein